MKLKRIAAGLYETPDGMVRVVQVDHEAVGPRNGAATCWEYMEPDPWHDWVVTNRHPAFPARTLREARDALKT